MFWSLEKMASKNSKRLHEEGRGGAHTSNHLMKVIFDESLFKISAERVKRLLREKNLSKIGLASKESLKKMTVNLTWTTRVRDDAGELPSVSETTICASK